jgi:DNA-directed RNA polymerase specialized sigma24 family protein
MQSDDEDASSDVRYTPEEVRAALDGLTEQDHARITLIARHFAPRTGMSYEDLRQEAFLRVLTTRTCKVGVDICDFLAGTIQSIASEAPRARKRARENAGLELVYVSDYGASDVPDPEDRDTASPEDQALARTIYAREVQRVGQLLAGDYELELLAEALADGNRGKELEELLGTDTKGLAAARKRLLRKMQVGFPNGVPL